MTVEDRIDILRLSVPCLGESGIDRLEESGFFTAPASATHHGNYEGGLFDHSLNVAEALADLTFRNRLEWQNPRSPWLVGMFHDLCKIDCYKHEIIGWANDTPIYGEKTYEFNEDTLYKGHGDKSVILLSSFLTLTPEEAACIRYHMGAFTDKEEWKYYTRAIREYPNVLWTHHADMIASHIKGV